MAYLRDTTIFDQFALLSVDLQWSKLSKKEGVCVCLNTPYPRSIKTNTPGCASFL